MGTTDGTAEGLGFKVFRESEGKLYGDYMSEGVERPRGSWLHERDYRPDVGAEGQIEDTEGNKYPTGWHIFLTRDAAIYWKMDVETLVPVEVRYRGARTTGSQEGFSVIVADEIFIPLEEVEA